MIYRMLLKPMKNWVMSFFRRRPRVLFVVSHGRQIEYAFLTHKRKIKMNPVTVSIGHVVNCALIYLDQSGNPMLTTPTPDFAPVWSNTTPATATLVASGDGLTAVETAVAAGSDTVNVSATVGGAIFTASVGVTVSGSAQTLTSITISTAVV